MQKKNKILMMAVSSLLCLTLISSCLVSSVFAKYVTKDTATATAVIEKFGVTLSVSSLSDADKAKYGVTVTDNSTENLKNAGVYSITVSGLKMGPGDTIDDLITFTIGGTANVDCQLKIDTTITYNASAIADNASEAVKKAGTFRVPKDELGVSYNYYFPVEIFCDAYNNTTTQRAAIICSSKWRAAASSTVSRTVEQILAKNFDLVCDNANKDVDITDDKYLYPKESPSTTYVYKDFKAKDSACLYLRNIEDDGNIYNNKLVGQTKDDLEKENLSNLTAVNTLKFGLKYYYNYSSATNKIATYFAQQENPPTFSVTFVFTITQTA